MADTAEITKEEWLERFKRRLRDNLGEHYDFKYGEYIAPTYWEDPEYREEGPEECADAETSEFGQE
jgi:hypothetical protein